MTTGFFSHDDCMKHNMGAEHPECPERLAAITSYLADTGLGQDLDWVRPDEATRDQLQTVHPERYLNQLDLMQPTRGRVYTDPDTAMMPDTLRAARLAAGASIEAVDMVLSSQLTNAFVCARPPGHHAERSKSMGFCFYNNIALAAMRALNFHQLERVAIIDFDVHQGNGTVDIVGGDERILMCSSFQHPFYPHSHVHRQAENIINTPIQAGTPADEYRKIVEAAWLKRLQDFRPQLVLVSAGFDGHRLDPMAELNLEVEDYRWLTEMITSVASDHANDRIISTLEGGYHLRALAESVNAHLEVLNAIH
ncbi:MULTISPECIES: histone deacetylase family protein [Marinobacter]|jgi:acetoin utilization deacetylase AcuC-like enzyme|uniref:Histone deacetylase-like amidohydrolase n=1 Tax=Marinobacter salarius TaxID=1420917 RepID=A0A1W6KBS5_9GAMM|nr:MULTISPECIES: histone deacetylase family protein [Marinobacter]ARM84749.1 histone deacetylase-like amidohydrolase [Marinobacter salarius]AZR39663.1 histone deacetylase [Marinobacter salarius]MBJ7302136.1 histone deacetylase family protein [Marinobacter salarius]MBS8229347.1 histone deacetylase family protein [Marinobacter salarius]MCZ4285998.1 histone deacetylase family protein [Marinobacter salarius]|tara:strand:+ start:1495 stop:2421 length:927 start_codon:yes stop_codon:yes gene_type:complete